MRITLIIVLILAGSLFAEVIWEDGFEAISDWTLTGEFEIGMPQGLGGEHGNSDPYFAYNGNNILGVDLSGLGNYPGDYENNLATHAYTAISPAIDCSQFSDVQLTFMKWLNVEQSAYDHAYISMSNNGGVSWVDIWENTATITESAWSESSYDISELADMSETVLLRFSIGSTDGSWQYSGWNLDNIVFTGCPVVYGAIEGNIQNSISGEPITCAQVYSTFGTAFSDEEGYFLLPHIPTGERTIRINALGYYTLEMTSINVLESDTTDVVCEMEENPDTPAAPLNLQADVQENSVVNLWWNEPADRDLLLAYNIYREGFIVASSIEPQYSDEIFAAGVYEYFVTAVYDVGESLPSNSVEVEIVEVSNNQQLQAADLQLKVFPNPFNPSTTISFSIEPNEPYELSIYNLKGQKIKTFSNHQIANSSNHQIVWNGCDENNKPVASGVYFTRLRTDRTEVNCKMLLLR
ncbi:MAG TPA: T9SS type A sorting domain-containing protein [Candidatus Cloacimonadota bacterium]|nr:T9SS type A sorting domain-containing protein [Candidatus Cloacimonadota bacterium]